jgi:two-component sensor histidine kinase
MTEHGSVRPEGADSLALAVIAASSAPLLLLDGDLGVVSASDSFCSAFEIDPATVSGRKLADLGHGEWNLRQLGGLLRITAAGDTGIGSHEMDLEREGRPARRLVLNARKLDYGDTTNIPANIRMVLALIDVTDARLAVKLKDDLLREKAILLQEVQHRVANSLQIVASVLMLSARRVQSDETRTHLRDAHQRVMSIAAVQRHLAVTTLNDVKLRVYLTELCASLDSSLVSDHQQITIEVQVDDSEASAETSVSLGLIVTELVINALKHAFPGHRHGMIAVSYKAIGSGWALSVRDTGIGMMPATVSKPGLGTGIVEALAKQLGAEVHTALVDPGTQVSIVHA